VRIKVVYCGQAQQITEKEEEYLETASCASVGNVIMQLIKQYGEPLAWLLMTNQKQCRRSVILAVNSKVVDPESDGCLKEDDELLILPAVSGG
jgi:MoaD family protein